VSLGIDLAASVVEGSSRRVKALGQRKDVRRVAIAIAIARRGVKLEHLQIANQAIRFMPTRNQNLRTSMST
jgi:hypothetical protein